MRRYPRLYAAYVRKAFVAFSHFRSDAVIGSLSSIVKQLAAFVGVWAILYSVGNIGGWTLYEIALVYAFFLMSRCLSQFFFDSFWNIGNLFVRRGQLDILLTRPAPVLFQVACNRIEFMVVGGFAAGAVLVGISLANLPGIVTIGNLLLMALFVIAGALINAAVYLIFNCLNFWLVQGNDIAGLVEALQEFTRYPLGVFPWVVSFVLTFIFPFAFSSYWPAAWLLGRAGNWVLVALPLVLAAVWAIALAVWRAGLRAYNSTGS